MPISKTDLVASLSIQELIEIATIAECVIHGTMAIGFWIFCQRLYDII